MALFVYAPQPGGTWASKAVANLSAYDAVHVDMKAGDALLFSSRLFHESAPYKSRTHRCSIDFRIFLSASDTSKSYYDPFHNKVVRID